MATKEKIVLSVAVRQDKDKREFFSVTIGEGKPKKVHPLLGASDPVDTLHIHQSDVNFYSLLVNLCKVLGIESQGQTENYSVTSVIDDKSLQTLLDELKKTDPKTTLKEEDMMVKVEVVELESGVLAHTVRDAQRLQDYIDSGGRRGNANSAESQATAMAEILAKFGVKTPPPAAA